MTKTLVPIFESKLPEYVRESYPNFVNFIKDHISFLEQDDGFLRIIQDWRENNEPSLQVEPYITAILKDLGFESGQHLQVNKNLMLLVLRDFYLARGSEESFRLLFRSLFGEEARVRYPREEMLVPSNAAYGSRHYIFTSANSRDTEVFADLLANVVNEGGTVEGVTSDAVAGIENISIIYGNGLPFLQIEITLPTVEFEVFEQVVIRSGALTIAEGVKPVLEIDVVDGGSGYSPGDHVSVMGTSVQGVAVVASTFKGGIESVSVENSGSGYQDGEVVWADNLDDDGFGFSARTITNGDTELVGVKVLAQGYNYETVPEIKINSPGSGAVLKGFGSDIGRIRQVTTSLPFVEFEDVEFTITSDNGSGAVLQARQVSRWSTSNWENRLGFIGENSTLIDSDKYQQFSYQLISSIPAGEYNSFVDELLHPVGYIRSNSFEIVSEGYLDGFQGGDEVSSPIFFEFEHTYTLAWESVHQVDITDVDFIVDHLGEEITDHLGVNLIAVFQE